MKKTIALMGLVMFLFTFTACENEPKSSTKDEHTAETALDYEGTYKGILPCADCPGIATTRPNTSLHRSIHYQRQYSYHQSR